MMDRGRRERQWQMMEREDRETVVDDREREK